MIPAKSEQPKTAPQPTPVTIKPARGEPELPRQVELGFMFIHSLMNQTSRHLSSADTAAFALRDLLAEKGVIEEEALKAQRDTVQNARCCHVNDARAGPVPPRRPKTATNLV
jgi:hypothetical protein